MATLQHTEGNVREAARILGIDRSTLYEKTKLYALGSVKKGFFFWFLPLIPLLSKMLF